jgi:hypothetical protein
MRELVFNDLSIEPLADSFEEAWKRVNKFIQTYKVRPTKLFGPRIRYESFLGAIQLAPGVDLQAFCNHPKGRTLGSLLLGLGRYPYIEPDSEHESMYLQTKYSIKKGSEQVTCYGLPAVILYDSIGISLASEPFWERVNYELLAEDESGETRINSIICVSEPTHFAFPEFKNWADERTETAVVHCIIPAKDKKIHLRNDHGKDELLKFSNRIVCSPFVIEIVNSLPFNPRQREFIKSTTNDGLVEIVLVNTDQGLGLVVKTTGRNTRETNYISELLKKQYGK